MNIFNPEKPGEYFLFPHLIKIGLIGEFYVNLAEAISGYFDYVCKD
jgi:hypothetical protein